MAKKDTTEQALKSLGPLGELVGKSAGALWGIFVRRYIAIGISELVGAAWLVWISLWFLDPKSLSMFVVFLLAGFLVYLATQNLINPHYPALGDVVKRVTDLNKPQSAELVQNAGVTFRT